MKTMFPEEWTPETRPAARPAVTSAERAAVKAVVDAALDDAGGPMTYEELMPVAQGEVPRLTNDEVEQVLDGIMEDWHGADRSKWPTRYVEAEEPEPEPIPI